MSHKKEVINRCGVEWEQTDKTKQQQQQINNNKKRLYGGFETLKMSNGYYRIIVRS